MTPTTPNLAEPAPPPPGSFSQPEAAPSRAELWVRRAQLVIEVVFFIWIGMFLVIAPWYPVWSHNSLVAPQSRLRFFTDQGFVRGIVSGLGLVNIWIGIWDAVHYSEK